MTVRQSSNLKCGGSIYAFKSLRFQINRLPPDDLSIRKNDERNWFSQGSTGIIASLIRRRSTSESQWEASIREKTSSGQITLDGALEVKGMR